MEQRAFSVEDLANFRVPNDVQLSPDGQHVAFVQTESYKLDKDTPSRGAIYLLNLNSEQPRLFAGDERTGSNSPRWSPDGTRLAFCSNRAGKDEMQLYVIDLAGGEAQRLTDLRGSVGDPRWSPDGQQILFTYSGILDKEKPKDPDPIIMDADPHFNRVWSVDIATLEVRALSPDNLHVAEYALSPDGRQLALIAGSQADNEAWYSAQLYAVNIESGESRQVCMVAHQIGVPAWSPDGQSIAFISGVMSDQGAVAGDVFIVLASGGESCCITPGINHSPVWIEWHSDGILYGAVTVEGTRLGLIDPLSGVLQTIWSGTGSIGSFTLRVSRAGQQFAAVFTDFDVPCDLVIGSMTGGEPRHINLMPEVATYPAPHVDNEHWLAPDGTPVQGYLAYPNAYQAGQRYPLVVIVHGGPSAVYIAEYGLNAWSWRHLLEARGCFVLMPNPRGSWGRGSAYQAANVGDLGGGDWQDINAGIDHLIQRGLVDADRLAITGWSYGGYMTAWAVTQTNRFRCAVAGAAITNNESNYGVVSIRGWQTALFGKVFYEDRERQRDRSPLSHVERVKTPTLLLHGQNDMDVPAEQSVEFYTALKHFGVPAQLVLYPREPHVPRERAHQIDIAHRIMEWFDRYLLS